MFNIINKYHSFGCYRFLNDEAKTIYIGSSKNIHNRICNQHFSKNGSNVDPKAYSETAKVEIIKTKDYPTSLSLELYLINEYKPKYNKKDKHKNINSIVVADPDYYKNLEKWQSYIQFREFDFNKIKTNSTQNILALIATFIFFISVIYMAIF